MKKCLLLIAINILFFSCKKDSNQLFSQISEKDNSVNFRKLKGSIKINDSIKFEEFQFSKNSKYDIHGYWGKQNDTLYFINSILLFEDTCYVKFPILVFNQEERIMVNQTSNCEDFPIFPGGYNYFIEVKSKSKNQDTFKIKHTLYTHSSKESETISEIIISMKHGIIDYKENIQYESDIIPWTLGIKKDWEETSR